MAQEFWNQIWTGFRPYSVTRQSVVVGNEQSGEAFLSLLGQVSGRTVLDLGCGNGVLSVFLAKNGAHVVAIDSSETAVANTIMLSEFNGVANSVCAHQLWANNIETLGQTFDFVVGTFILHHIEPFDAFVSALYHVLNPDGVAIFLENSSRNPLLMVCRRYLTGRCGIPKYSDGVEHPFQPHELQLLKDSFCGVSVIYPEFVFFSLLSRYLFRSKKPFNSIFRAVDGWIHQRMPFLRRYSYYQIVRVQKIR